jgi:hypothetical protein
MPKRVWLAAVLAVGVALAAAGCGDDDGSGDTGDRSESTAAEERVSLADQWAGTIEGTNAYISVFTLDDGQAGAYLADGADIATLLLGAVDDDVISLSLSPADRTTLTANVAGDEVTGTATLDGGDYAFTAERATGDAGWYRGRTSADGETVAAGFIVLGDGSFRGAVRRGDEVIANPDFDPSDLVLDVPGVGELEVLPVAKFVEQEQELA